jgi:hypothetical protein
VLSSNRSDQTSFTYTHTGRWHRVVWHFTETFHVEVLATYGGRVSTSGGWLPAGSTLNVTADTVNPWCYFSHWSGDVPVGQEQSASLTLTVDRPLFLRAHFPVTLHVSNADGDDAADGGSWETALKTVGRAVEHASLAGGTILVAPGHYAATNTLVLTNAISLLGASGTPADTSIFRSATPAYSVVRIRHPGARLAGFTVSNGLAAVTGGGNLWLDGGGTVSNCWITRHSVGTELPGGGIYNNNGRVTHCRISDSQGSHWGCKGAGIYQKGADAVTAFSEIFDNASSGHSVLGAGVYLAGGEMLNCAITNNRNNSATSDQGGCGGGLYISSGRAVNCLIAGNVVGWNTSRASGGGGVYLTGGSLVNCTVADNRARLPGGGGLRFAGTATLTNCIVARNTSPETDTEEWRGPQSTYAKAAYSRLTPLTNGTFTACTEADPAFEDADRGDWRLMRDSPCRDTGVLLAWLADQADLLGSPRVDHRKRIDMGAFETPYVPAETLLLIR